MSTKRMNIEMLGAFILMILLFSSCNDDDKNNYRVYQSLFTVKVDNGDFYFQSDKGNTFAPVNSSQWYKPEKVHRAFVLYDLVPPANNQETDYSIYVYAVDTILSKNIVANLEEESIEVYGDDPVKVERIWVGGGFLNLKFATRWGNRTAHFVNLIQEDETDLYSLRFRHNAYDDPQVYWGAAWVAFDLNSFYQNSITEEEVELKIKIRTSETSISEYSFTYKPDEDAGVEEKPGEEEAGESVSYKMLN